jgi:predicted nucleic acid-binding protein
MGRKRKILLDTNAIVYFLEGVRGFEVIGTFKTFYYSFITEIELLSYRDERRKQKTLSFLRNGKRIGINNKIIGHTIEIKRDYRLKTPDAIIVASAKKLNADLYTSDEEILKKIDFLNIHNLLQKDYG